MNMRMQSLTTQRTVALVTVFSLVLPSSQIVRAAQITQPAQTTQAPATQTPRAVGETPAVDGGWPRAYQTPAGAQMLVYQPQVASWDGQKIMTAYAAVSYEPTGATKPMLGTVKLEADTKVAVPDRLVKFTGIRVTETNFSTLSREQVRDVVDGIVKGIPDEERVIALDRVLSSVDKSQIKSTNIEGLKADPPTIFYSSKPAVLVNLDGEPVWSAIPQNDLKYAVNTNWDLFLHEPTQTYVLRNDQVFLKASSVKGPWSPAGALPASFSKLPADDNWKDVKAALPGKITSAASMPVVFVSTTPAELIAVQGAPVYEAVAGADPLMWLKNTEADVFRLGNTGSVYFLVAGRWFSAPGLNGPWTFATPSLPSAFAKIPLEHARSRVLASVPGTPQAAEAILLAQVPQTARVNRKELKAPDVKYNGEPVFEPIPTTSVARAVNTDKEIIKVGDLYYLCFQGVWFMARSATGPWEVATSVPQAIYQIPVSSPVHNVTYVTVEEDDDYDDDWVTFAAVAGYTGMMVGWGALMWGSGWYYPPYVGYGGFYPAYFPYASTYGFAARYNPWTGAYGRGAGVYGPYGGVGAGARYNPSTGVYSRGAMAYGPAGARGVADAYNPRTGTYARTAQGRGVYGSWGSTAVQRGDDWARTSRATNRATGTTTRATQGSGGGGGVTRRGPQGTSGVARTGSGDVYAGRDGNVYRREGGSWQQYNNGSWSAADRSAATSGQLNRDRAARTEGATRTRDSSSMRSSGFSGGRSGSYRPSGGGFRGGGGGFRGGGRR